MTDTKVFRSASQMMAFDSMNLHRECVRLVQYSKTTVCEVCDCVSVTERLESTVRQSSGSEQRSEIAAPRALSRSIRGELGRGGCRGLCGVRLGLISLGLRGRRRGGRDRLRAATGEVDQAPLSAPPIWLGLGLG